jgi:hypothetical protein
MTSLYTDEDITLPHIAILYKTPKDRKSGYSDWYYAVTPKGSIKDDDMLHLTKTLTSLISSRKDYISESNKYIIAGAYGYTRGYLYNRGEWHTIGESIRRINDEIQTEINRINSTYGKDKYEGYKLINYVSRLLFLTDDSKYSPTEYEVLDTDCSDMSAHDDVFDEARFYNIKITLERTSIELRNAEFHAFVNNGLSDEVRKFITGNITVDYVYFLKNVLVKIYERSYSSLNYRIINNDIIKNAFDYFTMTIGGRISSETKKFIKKNEPYFDDSRYFLKMNVSESVSDFAKRLNDYIITMLTQISTDTTLDYHDDEKIEFIDTILQDIDNKYREGEYRLSSESIPSELVGLAHKGGGQKLLIAKLMENKHRAAKYKSKYLHLKHKLNL